MVRRSASIALRIAAIAFGVLVVVAGFFAWRIFSGGPVSLGPLNSRLEAMINSGLKGVQLSIGDSVIEWSKDNKLAHLQFIDVEAVDGTGNVIARVPRANVSLAGPALLNGEAVPTRVEVIGVNALIVRRADGGMQLGFQLGDKKATVEDKPDPASEGMTKAVLDAMLNPKPTDTFTRYLTHFAVKNAKLTLFDEATRSYWNAEKASLTFDRKADGVVAAIEAPVLLANKSTWLFTAAAHYSKGAEQVALEAAFKPVRLKLLSASGTGLKLFEGLDIPVQGNATCDLSVAGSMGRCKFWLNAATGYLKLPALKKEPIHVKSAALTVELDFPTQRYSIEELTWAGDTIRGKVSGEGAFSFTGDGALKTLTADWTAENVSIDAPNVFDGALAIETAKLRAAFDAERKHLTIEEILARRDKFELTLSGELQDHPVSTGVVLNGGFKDLTVSNLKRLWPANAAPGARSWIGENVHEGVIPTGTIAVNIPAGAITGDRIPDEMMNITLALDAAKITYLNGLPDLTNVKGTATLLGDTFKAEIANGRIGAVTLTNGTATIAELHRHGAIGTISGVAAGPTGELLQVLDRPRLGYPSRYGIKAAQAGGTSNVKFTFIVPMLKDLKAEDIGIDVDAELKDVRLPVNDQLKITGGIFAIKLDMKAMKAHGAVQVNGAPTGFTWTEDFTGTQAVGTRIDVTATLNDEQRRKLGFDTSGYIQGKTTIVANFVGRGGKFQKGHIDTNLTSARLAVPEFNWAKPEDANATVKADVGFRSDGAIEIANVDAVGQGMKAQGRMLVVGGKLREADFKKLQLGQRNDFAVLYKRDAAGAETIEAKGRVADVGGLLESDDAPKAPKAKSPSVKSPVSVKADFDLAYLQGDVWFTGLHFEYANDGQNLTAFKVDASADAANVRGELVRNADNTRKMKLQTADAGRLIRALTGFRSMIGGDLILTAELSPLLAPGILAEPTFDGTLKIEKFKIVNQPFVARLLSAGSFTGIDDLLRGEGITFTKLEQVFQGRGDLITLTNGRAAGPSIGFTVQGLVNRGSDRIDLNGTIVPLYGLNSVFDGVPVIGDILTSNEGEGIFGVTYGVSGPVDELKVAVNPISMLAPGFLRKIFQMGPTPQAAAPMQAPTPKPQQNAFQPPAKAN